MSGTSYSSSCPKCSGTMQSYSDWKPFDTVSHECLDCGFYVYTAEGQYTLEEVNDLRLDTGMKKMKKLKKQTGD